MDATAIISLVSTLIKTAVDLGPTVIKGVQDAEPFAKALYDTLIKGKAISQDQLDELEARIDDLAAQLQEPLPPEG